MSEILESSTWENSIYRISKEDLVLGGPPIIEDGLVISGVANIAPQQLTNRTNYLKNRADVNAGAITALNIAMATANANIATADHRLDILEPIVATITASVVLAADEARTSAQTAGVFASNAGVSAAAAAASATLAGQHAADSVAAQAAAANAAASATAASTSKDAAALSATSATASKDAAATSATSASGSASAAATSATAANTSKTAAATSATNAGNSATAAAGSASDAATSATASESSRTLAAASASTALAFKNTATTAATAASASETNAGNSATASATSATNAAASATAASASKDAALGSANSAANSASAAGVSATSAGASAINAVSAAAAAAASAAEALANALPHYKGLFTSLAALESGTIDLVAGNYADVDEGVGLDVKRYIWDTNDQKWVTSGAGGGSEALNAAQVKVLYESNLNTNAYTDGEKAKLGGVAIGATANDTDANLKARANHTGEQAISTITGLQTSLNSKDTDILAAKDRANHTGTQAISTITGLQTALDGTAKIDDVTASSTKTYSSTKLETVFSGFESSLDSVINNFNAGAATLDANKVDKIAGKGLSTNDYTTTEKTKLAGVATAATANDTDANLRNRANHTGEQAISTITGLQAALDNAGTGGGGSGAGIDDVTPSTTTTYSSTKIESKFTTTASSISTVISGYQNADMDLDGRKVEKVTGKGLSTEDYTTAEKTKLASISTLLTPLVATTTVTALAAAANSIVNLTGELGANNLVLEVDVVSTGSYTVEFYNSINATGTLLYKAQLITGNYNDKFSYFVTAGTPALSLKITNNGTSALTATAKFTYIKLA